VPPANGKIKQRSDEEYTQPKADSENAIGFATEVWF
jgi:hypothetical protein